MIDHADFYLKTGDGQELAIYDRGGRDLPAVIYLHGGPGAGMNEEDFHFFDLAKWHVIAFDQRGCGNSRPFGTLEHNLVPDGVADIELIRRHYAIDRWIVFGGSYGSTLALSYAIAHPERTEGLVLRGVWLARKCDRDWTFEEGGASLFHPDSFAPYRDFIPEAERGSLIEAYYRIFLSGDEEKKRKACKIWASWEDALITLRPFPIPEEVTSYDLSSALLECHFMVNNMGWDDDNYILQHVDRIRDIPTWIVQGRYDLDCPPIEAWTLREQLRNVRRFQINEATGHLSHEPENERVLREIMDEIADERQ